MGVVGTGVVGTGIVGAGIVMAGVVGAGVVGAGVVGTGIVVTGVVVTVVVGAGVVVTGVVGTGVVPTGVALAPHAGCVGVGVERFEPHRALVDGVQGPTGVGSLGFELTGTGSDVAGGVETGVTGLGIPLTP